MIIPVNIKNSFYNIYLKKGILNNVDEIIKLNGNKALIVTDSGVPEKYSELVSKKLKNAIICTIPQGEMSKNFDVFRSICEKLLKEGFTRKDILIAVGGGVVGDISGFVSSCYMRGIDFYNIPTTVLSQVDSSIGGKTAINLNGIKNIIGTFYHPKAVIIDFNVLSTLSKRHISNGIAESIKMGITCDESLFEICEKNDYFDSIETIIEKSLLIKRDIVQKDEKENGLRRVLNFGHTIGHGIESSVGLENLYHGECVSLGIIPMCDKSIRDRVINALKNCNLPTSYNYNKKKVYESLVHDKKKFGDNITLVKSKKIGSFFFEDAQIESLKKYL